jgi:pentatricopeptide repeat protein
MLKYNKAGQFQRAIELFETMSNSGAIPTVDTFSLIFSICAQAQVFASLSNFQKADCNRF